MKLTVEQSSNLIDFLSKKLSLSKNKAKQTIDRKCVFVNNQRVWIATYALNKGDVVEYFPIKKNTSKIEIIYEDENIIAINKPPGVLSNNSINSAENQLRKIKKEREIRAIHRLDRDTSGVNLFAKDTETFEKFKEIWNKKQIEKTYLAIVHNEASFTCLSVDKPIEGKKATSLVNLIARNNGFSLLEIIPLTGRKHQIRVHLSSIRHPIVGDKEYSFKNIDNPYIKAISRQLLHAYKIRFKHPLSGEKIEIKAGIPEDFEEEMKLLNMKIK